MSTISVSDDKNILNQNSMGFEERQKDLELQDKLKTEQEEQEKKNHNFIMMYRNFMPEMRWLMKKSGIASSILNFIMEHMDNKNTLMCSYNVFIDYFEISKPTVTRAIKILYDNGFIDILKSGTSNVYIVNHEIAWTSWENQKKYCKFDGKILISQKENKDYVYKSQYNKFKQLREREKIKE